MGAPDDGFEVDPAELVEMVAGVYRAGTDLSNGLQKVRDGLMLSSAQGWEVDPPLARCANDWVQLMQGLADATSQAAERLAQNAQSYMDTEGGVCELPAQEEELSSSW
jgi:hypothetical protein